MPALRAKSSFYDQAKDSLSNAFNYAKNDVRHVVASRVATAASAAASTTTGGIKTMALKFKTLGERIADIRRMIKDGKIAMSKGVSADAIIAELNTHKYAGMDTQQMIAGLEESKMLKQSQPKPKPEELKPRNKLKHAFALPAPGMAA